MSLVIYELFRVRGPLKHRACLPCNRIKHNVDHLRAQKTVLQRALWALLTFSTARAMYITIFVQHFGLLRVKLYLSVRCGYAIHKFGN